MYAVPSSREQEESDSANSIEELFIRIAGLKKFDRDQLLRKISENLK